MPGTVKDLQGCVASGCLVAGLGGLLAALSLRLRNAEVSGLDANTARPRWLNLIGGRYVDGRQVTPDHPLDQIGTFDVIVEATGIAAPEFDLPPDDAYSNYRMANEALLEHVPCPAANVHPMPTHFSDPDAAARDYEVTLRRYFSGTLTEFDVVLLGLGPEGHTVSLFPGSPALPEATRWVRAVTVPADPPVRMTLTVPALNRASNVYFLVTGSNKARALHHILSGAADPNTFPAAGVRLVAGTLIWWVDQEAAAQQVDPD